jgi:phage repressor protein C with HTH and peptisase S24 domain
MSAKDIQRAWIAAALADGRAKGKTQKGIADVLGLNQSQGHRIAKGERLLNFSETALVERYLGKRAPRGIAASELIEEMADGDRAFRGMDDDFLDLPVYAQNILPGAGALPGGLTRVATFKLSESYLSPMSRNPRRLFLIEISDDSAAPFLDSGDRAVVDPAQTSPGRGGRYVIRVEDALQVKILSMNPGSKLLTARADNPDYPAWERLRADELEILGRVICVIRRLP